MRHCDPVILVSDELGTFHFCLFIFEQLKMDPSFIFQRSKVTGLRIASTNAAGRAGVS